MNPLNSLSHCKNESCSFPLLFQRYFSYFSEFRDVSPLWKGFFQLACSFTTFIVPSVKAAAGAWARTQNHIFLCITWSFQPDVPLDTDSASVKAREANNLYSLLLNYKRVLLIISHGYFWYNNNYKWYNSWEAYNLLLYPCIINTNHFSAKAVSITLEANIFMYQASGHHGNQPNNDMIFM